LSLSSGQDVTQIELLRFAGQNIGLELPIRQHIPDFHQPGFHFRRDLGFRIVKRRITGYA